MLSTKVPQQMLSVYFPPLFYLSFSLSLSLSISLSLSLSRTHTHSQLSNPQIPSPVFVLLNTEYRRLRTLFRKFFLLFFFGDQTLIPNYFLNSTMPSVNNENLEFKHTNCFLVLTLFYSFEQDRSGCLNSSKRKSNWLRKKTNPLAFHWLPFWC